MSLYIKQDGKCHYCGFNIKYSKFTIDHVIPKSKGGNNLPSNLVGACHPCNLEKRDMSIERFMEKIQNRKNKKSFTLPFFMSRWF